jgi:hypothetical protein
MAKYQILYWQHIPLTVKATDATGMVRQDLSGRFEEALKNATSDYRQVMHSTELRWSKEQERAGSANEVVAAVIKELNEAWDKDQSS